MLEGADLFIGLSGARVIRAEALRAMNDDAMVFAMANPDPEVMPEEAAPYVRIIATGRSDYPNQINNVLCFPGIFRGALDARAHPDHRGDEARRRARDRRRDPRHRAVARTTSSRASSTATSSTAVAGGGRRGGSAAQAVVRGERPTGGSSVS